MAKKANKCYSYTYSIKSSKHNPNSNYIKHDIFYQTLPTASRCFKCPEEFAYSRTPIVFDAQ